MRIRGGVVLFLATAECLGAGAENPVHQLWTELSAKREALGGFHEEFSVSHANKTSKTSQASKRTVTIDMAAGSWRERTTSGSGDGVRIFDGKSLYRMEEGGEEYVVSKVRGKEEVPGPYRLQDPDWARAVEVQRRPCEVSQAGHNCVVLNIPVRSSVPPPPGANRATILQGDQRISVDLETGVIIGASSTLLMDNGRTRYVAETTFALKHLTCCAAVEAGLFQVPDGAAEVKALSNWTISRIKKELVTKPAPELEVTSIDGTALTLADMKGKTVLLDFWATWCPPCRADAPALDKLQKKYGAKDLQIIGISVSEDRRVVEAYLRRDPHLYPVVLSTENDLPRAFQVTAFPTYILINADGKVAAAVQGDQGFSELRKLLKQAGLEVD